MQQLLSAQYQLIKGARLALLDYCWSMEQVDLYKKVPAFNNNTIADMLMHSAYTYIHWLVKFDGGVDVPKYQVEDTNDVADFKLIYEKVDNAVHDFLQRHSENYMQSFTKDIPGKGRQLTTTPLQLFTHVTTHEFHHKGQILTMSRILGYTPIDTDVIRY